MVYYKIIFFVVEANAKIFKGLDELLRLITGWPSTRNALIPLIMAATLHFTFSLNSLSYRLYVSITWVALTYWHIQAVETSLKNSSSDSVDVHLYVFPGVIIFINLTFGVVAIFSSFLNYGMITGIAETGERLLDLATFGVAWNLEGPGKSLRVRVKEFLASPKGVLAPTQ